VALTGVISVLRGLNFLEGFGPSGGGCPLCG
jgi:hypothetical protein